MRYINSKILKITKLAALGASYHKTYHACYLKQYAYKEKPNGVALYDAVLINLDSEYFNPLMKSGRTVNRQILLQKYQEQFIINNSTASDVEIYHAERLSPSKYGSYLIFVSQINPIEPQADYICNK